MGHLAPLALRPSALPVRPTEAEARVSLYDRDFVLWTAEQADLIREGRFDALDRDNLAEEVACMGGSQRSSIANRLAVVIEHLLKWEHQPDKRKYGWRATLMVQRGAIEALVAASPSLRAYPDTTLARAYRIGRVKAALDTGLPETTFPSECPYVIDEVLDDSFYPGPEEKNVV